MSVSKTHKQIETTFRQPASLESYWSQSDSTLFTTLQSRPRGLTSEDAKNRLKQYGANIIQGKKDSPSQVML